MSDLDGSAHRAQSRYWSQLVELKLLAVFARLYRDDQARWIRRIGIGKAIATSSTIAGWSIWKDYALIWGVILALSQLLDATKEYLPQQKHQRAASDLTAAAESLFIDAQIDWDGVFDGQLGNDEILNRWKKLAKLQLEAERKYFPDGVARPDKLVALAKREVDAYFRATYGVGDQP